MKQRRIAAHFSNKKRKILKKNAEHDGSSSGTISKKLSDQHSVRC